MTRRPSTHFTIRTLFAIGASVAIVWPVAAQSPSLALLDELSKGQWEIRDRDTKSTRRICVKTGREFIQLRHPGANCRRTVVEDGARQVAVQYTCRGRGYGRTSIRRETPSLVQIEGQGISGSNHYQFTAEARRIGTC